MEQRKFEFRKRNYEGGYIVIFSKSVDADWPESVEKYAAKCFWDWAASRGLKQALQEDKRKGDIKMVEVK